MITLDDIINNDNHKRLTAQLVARCEELAEIIRNAFLSEEVEDLHKYSVKTIRANSGFSQTNLYVFNEEEETWHNLQADRFYYFAGDFNCGVTPATRREKLAFLNDAKMLLNELRYIQVSEDDEIEAALSNTRDLK